MGCLYSGGLSLFWWTEYFGVLSLFWWAIFVVLGCLYSIGRTFFVDYLYSGGPSVFWWAAYNLSLLSCGQSNEILDYFFQLCVHTLHSILENVCFIELPCQPLII